MQQQQQQPQQQGQNQQPQQVGFMPQQMMGGQAVGMQGMSQPGGGMMAGMCGGSGAVPKFGGQVMPMMVPGGQFPGFVPQGNMGCGMQGPGGCPGDGMMMQ